MGEPEQTKNSTLNTAPENVKELKFVLYISILNNLVFFE
jgi:hypothetical protein